MHPSAHLAALPLASLALQGCVAAALPALAGGAMVRSGVSGTDQPNRETATSARQDVALADTPPQPAHDEGTIRDGNNISAQTLDGYAGFTRFAQRQAAAAKINSQTLSATLVDPGMLDGKRKQCGDRSPAVLIDLDHEGETFVPQDAYSVPAELAGHLDEVRDNGIEIAWISGASADQFGAIRYALSHSGLDKDAEDELLLMQYEDERKQTRREKFGETRCILAIAGDTPADFDELFLFLKSPDAAQSLRNLIGDGWFLTPLALTKQ